MRCSKLAPGGTNVFQQIRAKRSQALSRGQTLLDLSIGEPKGPALRRAREAASAAILSNEETMHAYQYNDSPAVPDFAPRFVNAHLRRGIPLEDVDYLPISGIKPILGLIPLACGCAIEELLVATMSKPGYPIPADWCAFHPKVTHQALPLNTDNKFRFGVDDIPDGTGLIMTNYPHNPSGQIADTEWFHTLCQYCDENDIRLFNDAAYISLSYSDDCPTLSEIATGFPNLSWCEGFTAAKLIGNGTGWHIGAMVGSSDFIGDLKEVKGKSDAGFVAPMAAGVLVALEEDQEGIAAYKVMYKQRLSTLSGLMENCGMRLAIEPRAGFYTLWETPKRAFGEMISSGEEFNFLMIENTGVVGVHFSNYLRYAVCADVDAMRDDVEIAFKNAQVSYD